jgi:hypothetical protein
MTNYFTEDFVTDTQDYCKCCKCDGEFSIDEDQDPAVCPLCDEDFNCETTE